MVVNQDHYINRVFHSPGEHELALADYDTRYVLLAMRVSPTRPTPTTWGREPGAGRPRHKRSAGGAAQAARLRRGVAHGGANALKGSAAPFPARAGCSVPVTRSIPSGI